MVTATGIRDMDTTHAATTAITGVLHTTERIITMVGLTTAAIAITNITSGITTVIKRVRLA